MPAIDVLRSVPRRIADGTRGRSRLIAAGAAAAAATVAATIAARRHDGDAVTLPDPAGLATETAVSVHNAAKSTMLAAARAAERPDLELITRTAKEAVADAIEAGVDLVPVALGVTGGAAEVAHLFALPRRQVANHAATASADAAAASGVTAASRVRDVFDGLPLT